MTSGSLLYPSPDLFPGGAYPGTDSSDSSGTGIPDIERALIGTGYEGIVVNQNKTATGSFVPTVGTPFIQEFLLPPNYKRGTTANETNYPSLAGFQLAIGTQTADTVRLDYKLEHYVLEVGWVTDSVGGTLGVYTNGDLVWADVYFADLVPIDASSAACRWRLAITTTADHVWFTQPNPLRIPNNVKAYDKDGTPLLNNGQEFSFLFRVLGMTADEGVDFLGNTYRSAAITQQADNIRTGDNAVSNQYWISGPQPSKFAAVSLYVDVSDANQQPVVVDALLLDPVTNGVYFSIYYSNDGPAANPDGSALSTEQWEQKLWTRVPKTFQALKRDNYAFPEPVWARYFKVEFTHLQARPYNPGDFQQPITYKKHPKWVLDYFMTRMLTNLPNFVVNRVQVLWDTIDLAYNYYLDDIAQAPENPVVLNAPNYTELQTLSKFLGDQSDVSDKIDTTTLSQISLNMRPYQNQPGLRGDLTSLLGLKAANIVYATNDYPVESSTLPTTSNFIDVSNYDRDAVVIEQSMPVMYFFVTCRHAYREAIATLKYNKAYFAAIQEMAFTRQHYTTLSDTTLYSQAIGDDVYVDRNDFVNPTGDIWVVYD